MFDVLGLENAQGHLEQDRKADLEWSLWDTVLQYSIVERRMSRHEQSSTTRCRVGLEGPVKEGPLRLGKIRQI